MPEPARLVGGRYELGDLIGRGGMADVHRAHDRVLHRDVALKLLRDVTSVDAERFATEARLLARLNHPSVVAVLDAGVDDARPWLALELVDGRPLDEVLRDDALTPSALAALGAQVADGLAHARAGGVVHRDVKPSNVLVTGAGVAKLSDFGIARLADGAASLTLTGHTIGTAAYLSPEQVRGEAVGSASDVYGFGLVLLEALTGTRAYPGPPVEAALARLHHTPLIPTSLPLGWPGLVTAMTRNEPAERPTAEAVAARLRELAGTRAVAAGPTPTATSVFAAPAVQTPAPARDHRRLAVVLVAAIVVLVLATALLARGGGQDVSAVADDATSSTSGAASSRATPSASTPVSSAPVTPVATTAPTQKTKQQTTKKPVARPGKAHPKPKKTKQHGKSKSRGKGPKKKR